MDNLRFIRRTMERSAVFTAVPGWATVAVGCVGLAAVALSGAATWIKVRRSENPSGRALRNFGLGLAPALVAGGAFSVRVAPLMGVCFMLLGAIAISNGPQLGEPLLALGFGGLHVLFGLIIAWKYGG